MFDETRWRAKLKQLEEALRPIARRPVDISRPRLLKQLLQRNPLDEAGVRNEAQTLLLDILGTYARVGEADRGAFRDLVTAYPSFFWATTPPAAETAAATLRLHLIHFALKDQDCDPRDALIWLDSLCKTPGVPPEEVAALRRQVAPLASESDRYGFGSTRSMLLRGCGAYGRMAAPEVVHEESAEN